MKRIIFSTWPTQLHVTPLKKSVAGYKQVDDHKGEKTAPIQQNRGSFPFFIFQWNHTLSSYHCMCLHLFTELQIDALLMSITELINILLICTYIRLFMYIQKLFMYSWNHVLNKFLTSEAGMRYIHKFVIYIKKFVDIFTINAYHRYFLRKK